MNHTPTFEIANPLRTVIEDSEAIIQQMHVAADDLEVAISDERTWANRYKEALAGYEMQETEHVAEMILLAQAKEGPLAGIATSSKAYDIVLTNIKNELRKPTGKYHASWSSVETVRRNWENAQIFLAQCETRFNALRKICELKANVLRASTI